MDTVGSRLRTLREQRKLTQMDVAVAVGTSRSNLTKIELDGYAPGREVLMGLAAFYDVSLDWLASGNGEAGRGQATAKNANEALLLYAFRELPGEEATPLLEMLLSRVRGKES